MTLAAEQITYTVRHNVILLDGVDFIAKPGEVTGILGANGAGKSTLLATLAGLNAPQSGRVTLEGRDIATLTQSERAARIAWLEQNATLHWPMSIERVVALGRLPYARAFTRETAEDHAAIEEAIQCCDLAYLRRRNARRLSGGELARVLLARAVATRAPVLLADEPVSSLDPAHQLQIMELLNSLASKGRTVVVVLHDLTLAVRYCQKLVLLDRGKHILSGPAAEVLASPQLERAYGVRLASHSIAGREVVAILDRLAP